jgi:3-oxoadipate enol-lactonase
MTLVFLHAFPLDSRIWKPQLDALETEFPILAPDLRGFGTSDLGGLREIPIDLAADDVVRLLDAQDILEAVIVGISRGGYIAMSLARRYPERVRALILMDTRATPADDKERQWWQQLIDRTEAGGIAVVPELMRPRLLRPDSPQPLVNEVNRIILAQPTEGLIAAARGMPNRPDATPFLAAIGVPVLALAGEQDGAFESTRAIAASIPGANFLAVPHAGHLSNMEQPALVNQALRAFMKSAGGA